MGEVAFRTSGSTGRAKEILRTEETLAADARAIAAAFPEVWGAVRRVVATIPEDHMFGALWRVRAPAAAGCAVHPGTIVSVEGLAAACEGDGQVLFETTPSFLEQALGHPGFAALRGKIGAVVTSGSLLRRETALGVREALGTCPLEIFGSTETGTVAWRRQEDGEEWTVFPGVAASADGEGRIVVDSPYAQARPMAMGDAVRFTAPGRFLLLGRTDRRVKVLEQYVSLDGVERAFSGHPLVAEARAEPYGEGVRRIGVLAVPSAEGRTALAGGTFGAVQRRLRRDLLGGLGALAFPRRIRFVRALPADGRGKATAAAVARVLGESFREPVVTSWSATAEALSAGLVFPPDMECFEGHFPGFPILPGVAQLFYLRHFARQAFADYPDAGAWRRLKFRKLVRPGVAVRLDVARRGTGVFDFEFGVAEGPCSSGRVEGRTE